MVLIRLIFSGQKKLGFNFAQAGQDEQTVSHHPMSREGFESVQNEPSGLFQDGIELHEYQRVLRLVALKNALVRVSATELSLPGQ